MDQKNKYPSLAAENETLRRREALYFSMIEEIQDYSIIFLTPDGIIQNWNRGAQKIKLYKDSEIIGQSFEKFYLQEDRDMGLPQKLLKEAETNGHALHEGWRLRKDQTRFWGSVSLTAIHNISGELIGFSKITRDLTEKKLSDERARESYEKLRQSNQALQISEERYHKMIAEVEDYAIIGLDEQGFIQNWNAGAQKIKGYNWDEILGRHFSLFYLQEDRQAGLPSSLLERARREGRVIHEGWRIRRDGTKFWGSVALTALHDNSGQVIGFSKVTRDLTEKKQAEDRLSQYAAELLQTNEALRKSEERYQRMILEVQDYAIILLNEDGDIQNWNVGAERIKGYTALEILGKNFRIFYLPEDRQNNLPEKLINEAVANGRATHEGWRLRKDGSRFWGSIVITSLHNETGGLIGFSKMTRDLTEKKHAEDKMLEYLRELENQNKELEQFAYIASHDLQEPLRKIRTFIEIIEKNFSDPEITGRFFSKIQGSAARMMDLISSVLDYSRLLRGGAEPVSCDLNDIIKGVCLDFDLLIQEKQAVIHLDNLPVVRGVPLQMHQLFSNLVSNALKFTSSNPFITIRSETVPTADIDDLPSNVYGTHLNRISVEDNGIGFDNEYSQLIFQMFQRLHNKDNYSGTGIGLALCKKIIENHNGFITATSVIGKGATFSVYFPA